MIEGVDQKGVHCAWRKHFNTEEDLTFLYWQIVPKGVTVPEVF